MDIPALSMALSQSKVMNQVGVSVLKNVMDFAKETGAGIAEMLDASEGAVSTAAMEQSVTPYLGGNIDVSV